MEADLLRSEGYPEGSYVTERILHEEDVPASDWEIILSSLDGDPKKALEILPQERVYEKQGCSIVYVVIPGNGSVTIFLGALEVPGADILWKSINAYP